MMEDTTLIRLAVRADVDAICRIYNHYVLGSTITFEEQAISPLEMSRRLADTASASLPWLVVEQGGTIHGYAFASNWKARSAYRHSTETTIYLAPHAVGHGLGTRLYRALLDRLADCGRHVAIGGVALPNDPSISLHEKLGFRKVAHFSEVGFKFGRWIDTTYWQRIL
jgi:L-amino acid N-acyltransferase YncA